MKCPANSGSVYINYKKFFSQILTAWCDADYNVIWLEVGAEGSAGDGGVFEASGAKHALENNLLNFPAPEPLYPGGKPVPYFGAGDNAYPQRRYLMTPYSGLLTLVMRLFNYRLSRARRVIENFFGILAHKNRCILGCFQQRPEVVTGIVKAAACMHNLQGLRYEYASNREDYDYEDDNGVLRPGVWRSDMPVIAAMGMQPFQAINDSAELREGKELRDYLAAYFCGRGQVSWQLQAIQNGWY